MTFALGGLLPDVRPRPDVEEFFWWAWSSKAYLRYTHQPYTRYLADSLPPEKKGLEYSLTILATAPSVVAPFLASAFVSRMGMLRGMRLLYAVLVAICLATAFLRMGLRETLSGGRSVNPLQALKAYPDAVREGFKVWSSVPKEALWLSIIYVVSFSFTWMCSPYYVIYATEELGVSEKLWAVLMSVNSSSCTCPRYR